MRWDFEYVGELTNGIGGLLQHPLWPVGGDWGETRDDCKLEESGRHENVFVLLLALLTRYT